MKLEKAVSGDLDWNAVKDSIRFIVKKDGETVVEDSKGYRNPSSAPYAKFVLKRKLMLWIHGIRITEV